MYQLLLFGLALSNSGVYVTCLQNVYCQLPCDISGETVPHTVCERGLEQKCGPDPKCGPDFMAINLSEDDKQYILDIHNYLRNKVAIGFESRGGQPQASNMQIMKYNKELEFIAQCWANSCNGNPLKHDMCRRTGDKSIVGLKGEGFRAHLRYNKPSYTHVGQNLGYINTTNPKINKVKAIKDLILLWYDEVTLYNSSWIDDTQNRGPGLIVGHYTQLVWADSAEIGCAMTYYTETLSGLIWHQIILVCNYGPGGNYLGRSVYKIGRPASECPQGTGRNFIYKGLCGEAEIVREVANFTFDAFQLE